MVYQTEAQNSLLEGTGLNMNLGKLCNCLNTSHSRLRSCLHVAVSYLDLWRLVMKLAPNETRRQADTQLVNIRHCVASDYCTCH